MLFNKVAETSGDYVTSPSAIRNIFQLRLTGLEREEFHVAFLTTQHEIIAVETMFTGTIDSASVYPREIAKRALQLNAAAVILAHNHPSGTTSPSLADQTLTKRVKAGLELLDVRTLDHIIVAGKSNISFAEKGLI
jgi:DNA repair protein RadC